MDQARFVWYSMFLVGVASLQRLLLGIMDEWKGKNYISRVKFCGSLWRPLQFLILIPSSHSHEDVGIGIDPMLLKAINRQGLRIGWFVRK